MMYDGYVAEFMLKEMASEEDVSEEDASEEVQQYTEATLLMDFSHAELNSKKLLIFAIETYNGTTFQEQALAETKPDGGQVLQTAVIPVEVTDVDLEEGAQSEETEQEIIRYDKLILNQDHYLELTFPAEWECDEPEYSVELLSMTEEGALEYREVTLAEEALSATYTKDENEHKLELKIGQKLPQAGTYRLKINWKYKGICFKQTQTTFFINYSVYLNKDLSSQGVQTDD